MLWRQSGLDALLVFDLVPDLAFGFVCAQDGAHDQPEDQTNQQRRDESEQRVD